MEANKNKVAQDIHHIGFVVPDSNKTSLFFSSVLGFEVSDPIVIENRIKITFVILPKCKIEIIEPLDPECEHGIWLKSHPKGGIHHICYHTENIEQSITQMENCGIRKSSEFPIILPNGDKIQFFNDDDTFGILTELLQIA